MIGPVKIRDLRPAEARKLLNRGSADLDAVRDAVEGIVCNVRDRGDQAVAEYTEQFDKAALTPGRFKVQKSDITRALRTLPKRLALAMRAATANIEDIHRRQLPRDRCLKNRGGVTVWELYKPLRSVGIYVPGGRAAYPSTALMLSIPARVAGVKRIVACSPPREDGSIHPATLAALHIGGVTEIYRIGGVQAVAAMAYGTESIPQVDKIVGPGNIYVATAKMRLNTVVGVDFTAGPSEVVILASDESTAKLAAWDMMAQAEHDPRSVAVTVATSQRIADKVKRELDRLLSSSGTPAAARQALENSGAILVAESIKEAVDFINDFAPEHLQIAARNPWRLLRHVATAGSVSVGRYTPVAATDYAVGTNHVLPTGGSARYSSALSVRDFLRAMTVQELTATKLRSLKNTIGILARSEGLAAHAASVDARLRSGR